MKDVVYPTCPYGAASYVWSRYMMSCATAPCPDVANYATVITIIIIKIIIIIIIIVVIIITILHLYSAISSDV